jgi:gas vesicle protein
MNTVGKIAVGFLAGASLGILAGILIAPDKGKKTRDKLVDKSKDMKDWMSDSFDDVRKAYNKKVETFASEGKAGIETLKNGLKV